jgi:uncharacterized membrane protein (DUF373 family)
MERDPMAAEPAATVKYRRVHHLFRKTLETAQDLIIILLAFTIFFFLLKVIFRMIFELSGTFEFKAIVSEILYTMILVETYRMLIIYLREHRVAVDFVAEIGLAAVIREVLLVGVLEIHPMNLLSIVIFSLTMLLVIKVTKVQEMADREEKGFLHEELFPVRWERTRRSLLRAVRGRREGGSRTPSESSGSPRPRGRSDRPSRRGPPVSETEASRNARSPWESR